MIQNIVLLLVANIIIPYTFVPPILLVPVPLAQAFTEPPSVLESMNLSRLHTSEQFRQAFKKSLRVHHPDHGGSQQVFQQIQGLKKIMSKQTNYYDLYNLTDADMNTANIKLEQTVLIKQYTYYVETGIFYFITFLYILAFTLDSEIKTSRMLMLGLTIFFALYQFYIHEYPTTITIIDLFCNKLPLFTQRKFMKRTLIIWIALIKAYFDRIKSEESILLNELKLEKSSQEYRDILERLQIINQERLQQKQKYEKSWMNRVRGWISKAISIIFLLLIIKNMIPGLNML